ncbi:MAG TPA: prolipoprotein diacylglyceryl transferase family protein, partial [bacterium]|nr:prolipoprotein diacylglyceryl transferase family protein [bacterium]
MFPLLLKLGPLEIYTYGVLTALGFYLGLMTAEKNAGFFSLTRNQVDGFFPWLFFFGLAGARLFHFLLWDLSALLERPVSFFYFWEGGLSVWGGLGGGLLALFIRFGRKGRG